MRIWKGARTLTPLCRRAHVPACKLVAALSMIFTSVMLLDVCMLLKVHHYMSALPQVASRGVNQGFIVPMCRNFQPFHVSDVLLCLFTGKVERASWVFNACFVNKLLLAEVCSYLSSMCSLLSSLKSRRASSVTHFIHLRVSTAKAARVSFSCVIFSRVCVQNQ